MALRLAAAILLTTAGAAGSSAPLPRAGFFAQVKGGVAVIGLDGRVQRVLNGYSLFKPRRLNTQMLDVEPIFARLHGGTVVYEPASRRFVPTPWNMIALDAGAKLIQLPRRAVLVVRGKRDVLKSLGGGMFVSERRDVVTLPGPTAARGYVVRNDINRAVPKGCRVASTSGSSWYLLCGYPWGAGRSSVKILQDGDVRFLVPPASRHGWWTNAYLSPNRKTLLLQWSGECEVPSAWYAPAAGGTAKTVAGDAGVESVALGWAPDGRAVVRFPRGACAAAVPKAGIYLVDIRSGRKTFVRRNGIFFRSG